MDNFKKVRTGKIIKSKVKLSVIIPCYNEESNITVLFKNIKLIKKEYFEIIIVNNGSTDSTRALLKTLNVNLNLTIINLEKNIGYGGGILEGINFASGEVISWTHADLQTDIRDVINSYKFYISNPNFYDFILKGKRIKRDILDSFFTFMMSFICSSHTGYHLTDINAQPKIFHRSFLKELDNAPTDFSLDLFFLYRAKYSGKTILEYPVKFNNRLHGESKGGGSFFGKVKLTIRTLNYIFKIKKR